ncbi:hypothetical protein [Alcanivorax sp. DP30]|uniref:hypothetical protein n=1 Tax=Alcanivorax sp. DP30 TaxID=2606217 RepID=UPI001368364C|nr:hypothetical protein [Alcanivorax sp. DP30]MZR61322.1 hypothetical protein [Alcanivorax sp. DP30]
MIPYYGLQAPATGGHYESWFVRANHPLRPQALWIRYTLFRAADNRPALGEVWAMWFDGEQQRTVAAKQEFPLDDCHYASDAMRVDAGDNHIEPGKLTGQLQHRGQTLQWDLHYNDGEASLLFLPASFYERPLPKAKSLVSRPMIQLHGTLNVNGEIINLDGWRGSENHNWGSQHTDRYAWGQVAGFDNAPEAFLECATAQIRLGPVYSPKLSIAALCLDGERFLFNTIGTALKARAHYRPFEWSLETRNRDARLMIQMDTTPDRVAALTYYNPPGGNKFCLNSKLARVTATFRQKGKPERVLHSAHGGAFEILTDQVPPGVELQV